MYVGCDHSIIGSISTIIPSGVCQVQLNRSIIIIESNIDYNCDAIWTKQCESLL